MAGPCLEVHVRPARRGDIPGIVAVAGTSVTDAELEGFGGPSGESPFRDEARLNAEWVDPNLVGSELVFVAEAGATVVGSVTVERRGPELELVDIDVAGHMQGRGIGGRLVAFVEELALSEGAGAVTLGTSRNADGVPWKSFGWWQSLGYRVTHEEENEWTRSIGPGAREIRMRKDLSGQLGR
jgi:ribosomal protein S18 acetylase RimI-like enzyme